MTHTRQFKLSARAAQNAVDAVNQNNRNVAEYEGISGMLLASPESHRLSRFVQWPKVSLDAADFADADLDVVFAGEAGVGVETGQRALIDAPRRWWVEREFC